MKARILCFATALLLSLSSGIPAADYPSKPIRVIVTFGAGTASDIIMRLLTEQLQADTGANFIIENVPGANGIIGANKGRAEKPDGYALVQTGTGTHSLASALFKSAAYDPIRDFDHLALITTVPNLVVVKASSTFKDLDGLVKSAKDAPGRVTYAYASAATQIQGASLEKLGKFQSLAVPYKASTEAITDILGGRLDYLIADAATVGGLIRAGELRALVALGEKRAHAYPSVPTLAESGMPPLQLVPWVGIAAPAGIPADVKTWLLSAINKAMSNPKVIDGLHAKGAEVLPGTNIDDWVRNQQKAWVEGAKSAGVAPQ